MSELVGPLWDYIMNWASTFVVWKLSAASLAKTLAVLATLTGIVQAIKKALESAGKWQWLLKLVPQLKAIFDALAHGWGPVIITGIMAVILGLTAAVQDGVLTAAEIINLGILFFGSQGLYKGIRAWLFPNKSGPVQP